MSVSHESHEWIVGMDLTATSHGAIRLAQWLHERWAHAPALRGVYVGSTATIERELPGARLPGERACLGLRAAAESLGAGTAFAAFEAIPDDAPEQALAQVAEAHDAEALVIGRAGPVGEWSLVSLGRVARRLLRHVPRPIVVVPPDLDPDTLGRGPVVIGAAPVDHAEPAVRFGHALAEALGLPTLLVYAIPDPATIAVASAELAFPPAPLSELGGARDRARMLAEAERELSEWLGARGLPALPVRAEPGRKAWALLDVARAEQATMIVCGSRRLSLAERIFQSSVGTELAARADRPVIVVPPREDDASGPDARL